MPARLTRSLFRIVDPIAPPRCLTCPAPAPPGAALCARCERELGHGFGRMLSLPGLDLAWAARSYAGASRRLVGALKFRRLLPAAARAAALIAGEAPAGLLAGALVPVPADPLRRMLRGFDPSDALAGELSRRTRLPREHSLARRHGPRQVGRPRAVRLERPPRVRATAAAPPAAVLVDDVVTTGATLAACARALREAGSQTVVAVTLAASHPEWLA